MKKEKKRYLHITERLLFTLSGAVLGFGGYSFFLNIQKTNVPNIDKNIEFREIVHNYKYVDPLLTCDNGNSPQSHNYALESQLKSISDDEISRGNAKNISVYLRQLNTGEWAGIDEDHLYDPASLLKIVLMITYYKDASTKHFGVLSSQYIYTQELEKVNDAILFHAPTSLNVGKSYTVDELIRAMIVDSDNGATFTLLDHVDSQQLALVYKELDILDPDVRKDSYKISSKKYSLFFRILYNATYLDEALSEKALELLTKTTYYDGLVAALPKDVVVAHKYGEHVNGNQDGNVASLELHDCGIIYKHDSPYFLCVMTSGQSLDKLSQVIQRIAKEAYGAIDTKF